MSTSLQVSVRALVEHSLRGGDLDLESLGRASTLDAIRAHQKVQASRGDGYRKEVSVSRTFERKELLLLVEGRIDGLWERASGALVEEIKTTSGDPFAISAEERPTHWGQLKVYAFFVAEERGLETVDTRLTYYRLGTGETSEVDRRFSLAELRGFVEDLVSRYLDFLERALEWRASRDRSVRSTAFPFPSYRVGQREMAVAAYRTIRDGGELLVRAPTGVGKTQAALFPAVKALGEGRTDRLFYLTARTTGRVLAERALAELRRSGLRLRSLTLTAKEKICFNPERACNAEECDFARGFYDRIGDAVDESLRADELSRSNVELLARKHRLCPFELSLELATWSDVVICDYNYAFDPRALLRRFFASGSPLSTLLVDEAHNLVDRARDMFSASVARESFLSLKRALVRERDDKLIRAIDRVTRILRKTWKEALGRGGAFSETEPPRKLLSALSTFLFECEAFLGERGRAPRDALRRARECMLEAAWFSRVAESWDETYSACHRARGRDLSTTLFCSDPGPKLGETFGKVKASILFSATLLPMDYFRRCLGLGSETPALALPPAFPEDHLGVFVATGVETTYRRRSATAEELTRLLSSFVGARPGHYLVYFPSYEYLRAIHERFVLVRPDVEVLAQGPGMSEEERGAFLERFERPEGTLVGFAVMGGVFGEGVDLPGDKLEGAAIVGVGLPALSPERDRIRERFDRVQGAGFDYAYVFPGMNRVLQAAGRVIRSEKDRGAVLLVDERFLRRSYRALFPPEWKLRLVRNPPELERELGRFWKAGDGAL